MSTRELETYLYDRFPLTVGINASWEEYLGAIRTALGVNIVFRVFWQKEYPKNKIIKKNIVFFEGGSRGSDFILMYSPAYGTIRINKIYSTEPIIRRWENK